MVKASAAEPRDRGFELTRATAMILGTIELVSPESVYEIVNISLLQCIIELK